MKWCPDIFKGLICLAVTVVPLVTRSEPAGEGDRMPMENVRLPVEYYPDGAPKTEIRAAGATMPSKDGEVTGRNVMVMFFKPDGKTIDGRIWAETCRFNRDKGVANSKGRVRLEREGVRITGRGFDWNAESEIVRIHSDVRVEIDRGKVRKEWKNVPTLRR